MTEGAAHRWVERMLGTGWRVVADRRLTGGIASVASTLTVQRDGRRRHVVLRCFEERDPRDPSLAVEVDVLRQLEHFDVPAPIVLGVDLIGEEVGLPALLMERLPGRIELRPDRVDDYVGQMARMLVRIHHLEITAPPTWSSRGDPAVRFVHGDYQHFNLLWSGGRLRGVVDWSLAGIGSPDRDLAHCRLNLVLLHGPLLAEEVREVWEAEMGRSQDAEHDLAILSQTWHRSPSLRRQVGRRLPVDWEAMEDRLDALVTLTRARL